MLLYLIEHYYDEYNVTYAECVGCSEWHPAVLFILPFFYLFIYFFQYNIKNKTLLLIINIP